MSASHLGHSINNNEPDEVLTINGNILYPHSGHLILLFIFYLLLIPTAAINKTAYTTKNILLAITPPFFLNTLPKHTD